MGLTVQELQDSSKYKLLDAAPHDTLIEFIALHFNKRSLVRNLFDTLLIANILALILFKLWGKPSPVSGFESLGWAVLFSLAFIPVHEWLHGITYRFFGARDIRYHTNLKYFMFYAVAHDFVVSAKEFIIVALVPFLALETLCIAIIFIYPHLTLFALFTMLINLLFAGGDSALLNYIWLHRGKGIWTYDDDENKISYFYTRFE